MKKKYSFILFFSVLLSCSSNHYIEVVSKNDSVTIRESYYLVRPENGYERNSITKKLSSINTKSSNEVTETFVNKYQYIFKSLNVSSTNISNNQGFINAKSTNSKYLITIKINEWTDAKEGYCKEDEEDSINSVDDLKSKAEQRVIENQIEKQSSTLSNLLNKTKEAINTVKTVGTNQDTVDILISIYDVETQKLLNQQKLYSKGCPTESESSTKTKAKQLAGYIVDEDTPSKRLNTILNQWIRKI